MYAFFFKIVYYYVNKTESLSTCHIFSKLLFFANFVNKALVDDGTKLEVIHSETELLF